MPADEHAKDSQAGLIVAANPDGLARFDHNLVCTYASPSVGDLFHRPPGSLPGCALTELGGDDAASVARAADQARDEARIGEAVIRLRGIGGGLRWIEMRCAPLAGTSDLVASFRDVTMRRSAELALRVANSELSRLAGTDAATGLANRRRFEQALQLECRRAARQGAPVSLVLLAVENITSLAARHGTAAAEADLKTLAGILARMSPQPAGLAVRLGVADFALLLPQFDAGAAGAIIDMLRGAVAARSRPGGLRAATSLGRATVWPTADTLGTAEATLLTQADRSLQMSHPVLDGRRSAGADGGHTKLDMRPTPGMHQIARIAATLLGLPTALVLKGERESCVVAGHHGWDGSPLASSWWGASTGSEGGLAVFDTDADPAFRRARVETGFAFLAAAPLLRGPGRQAIGTLWVADTTAKQDWSEADGLLLMQLAGLAADTIDGPESDAEVARGAA